MTDAAVVHSDLRRSADAGLALGSEIRAKLGGHSPDALVVFASPQHDYPELLRAIHDSCEPAILVGCSSAGEFTSHRQGEGLVSAVALRSSEMKFAAGLGRGLRRDRQRAAEAVVRGFKRSENVYRHRSALVLTDALAGHADDLVERLTLLTGGAYSFFGGGPVTMASSARHTFSSEPKSSRTPLWLWKSCPRSPSGSESDTAGVR